ncbi:MAG: DUF4260 family protein [Anaerolineae bacterium]|nr:DUF4260 family protein [Anaerolineae bacterium]
MTANNTQLSLSKLLLHAEGGAIFITACILYARIGANGWIFALLFFSFDIFMLGYLRNPQLGSLIYNIGHTEIVPLALILLASLLTIEPLTAFALIWLAHIGLDRLLGYGLKYPTHFKDSHLQRV